jgi:tetratricopeptide (TPR) repeat protein
LLVLLAATLLCACRISPTGALIGPSIGGEGWAIAESAHFTVRADLSEKETAEIAMDLERTYRFLFEIGFPMEKDPGLLTDAVVFRTREEYNRVGPKASDGFFRRRGFGRDDGGTFMTYGGVSEAARHVFVHEMTHRFVYHVCPQAPVWLNEGLADYYETATYGDGKAVLGRSPYGFKPGDSWVYGRAGIPVEALPSWDVLTSLDHQSFYTARAAPDGEDGREARQTQATNYASAWATVYVLHNRPDHYGDRLYQWMAKMASGLPAAEAFRQAFRDMAMDVVDKDRKELLDKLAVGDATLFKLAHDERRQIDVSSRALRPAEQFLVLARLDLASEGDNRSLARQRVDDALAKEPDLVSALLLSADLYLSMKAISEAEAELDKAARLAPDDEAVAAARFDFYSHPLKGNDNPPERVEKAEEILTRWAPRAHSPALLNNLAWYMTLHHRAAQAIPLVKQSIAGDPSCGACYDTLALALFRTGDFKTAVGAQDLALAVYGERNKNEDVVERRRLFQAAWSSIVLWKKHPVPGRDPLLLPPEVVSAILRAQMVNVEECYQRALRRDPGLTGSLLIRGEIGVDGKFGGVELVNPITWDSLPNKPSSVPLADDDLARCALEQISSSVFPESSRATPLTVPLSFESKKRRVMVE